MEAAVEAEPPLPRTAAALAKLKAKRHDDDEAMRGEAMGKLKDLGNSVRRPRRNGRATDGSDRRERGRPKRGGAAPTAPGARTFFTERAGPRQLRPLHGQLQDGQAAGRRLLCLVRALRRRGFFFALVTIARLDQVRPREVSGGAAAAARRESDRSSSL
jgi:hypothetical protein